MAFVLVKQSGGVSVGFGVILDFHDFLNGNYGIYGRDGSYEITLLPPISYLLSSIFGASRRELLFGLSFNAHACLRRIREPDLFRTRFRRGGPVHGALDYLAHMSEPLGGAVAAQPTALLRRAADVGVEGHF